MRDQYPEFYARTEEELTSLWSSGLVAVDANVLLGLYQYPAAALTEFVEALNGLGKRLWLPYQVGLEYQRNRVRAMPQPRQSLERVSKGTDELRIKAEALGFPEYHPSLDLGEAEKRRLAIVSAIEQLDRQLIEALGALPAPNHSIEAPDQLRDTLGKLFEGQIGSPPPRDKVSELHKEADKRFASMVPPGYKDRDKDSESKYGDFLIWKSLLAELKSRKEATGLIFVTNDQKEDWWVRKEKEILGPRPELIRECLDETGRLPILYTPSDFLRFSKKYLKSKISPATVEVAERVSRISPPAVALRNLRMALPEVKVRGEILRHVFAAIEAGGVRTAGDIGVAIESFGGEAVHNYVANPLFYSLISEAYGVLRVEGEDQRLRDRRVSLRDLETDAGSFVQKAHIAWLAQALYRLRSGGFSKQEMADAFFGIDAGGEALQLIEEASRAMEADALMRGH